MESSEQMVWVLLGLPRYKAKRKRATYIAFAIDIRAQ